MRFTLFGIPTEIHPSFLFGAVLLGLNDPGFLPVWVVVVVISVLIHELGHALTIRAFGLRPEISLQWLGGLTSWSGGRDLSRPKRVFVSFAGPLAGFVFAGLVFLATLLRPDLLRAAPPLLRKAALTFQFVNLFWGIINLAPVSPLDGGHMLEHTLGPKRARLAAGLSTVFGILCAILGYTYGGTWLAFLFGMLALQSFQRFQAESPDPAPARPVFARRPVDPPLSPELERELKRAADALAADAHSEARAVAERVLAAEPPRTGRIRALELIAWSFLLEGALDDATRAVRALERHGTSDAALAGGLLFARGELAAARAVFEAARSVGDDRKEVVGPLIQILIADGETARAAATAVDIVETLSDDDVSRMAKLAEEGGAHDWAARLDEALYEREPSAEAAFTVARARSLAGDAASSLAWIAKATSQGLEDRARVWHDLAFAPLHSDEHASALEALVPRN
ncbi:MAG: hypothetical protein FJ095_15730 [Deltaproteobacteria bacterium]|nr:hypothetical protein [Deltaproteobacteria bacterium]